MAITFSVEKKKKKKKCESTLILYFVLGPKERKWNYTLYGIPTTILQDLNSTN